MFQKFQGVQNNPQAFKPELKDLLSTNQFSKSSNIFDASSENHQLFPDLIDDNEVDNIFVQEQSPFGEQDDCHCECLDFPIQNQEEEEYQQNQMQQEPAAVNSTVPDQQLASFTEDLECEESENDYIPTAPFGHKIPKTKIINRPKKRKRNTNSIKKLAEIILKNVERFGENEGAQNICEAALENQKKGVKKSAKKGNLKPKDKWDRFNLSQLESLYFIQNEQQSRKNLLTTRQLLKQKLRDSIFESVQMSEQNKALYMITLKVSGLRSMNKKLAVRLQIPEEILQQK